MIPDWLYTLAGIALCVLLIPYVLGPILIFFTLRFRMPPTVVAVDPRVHPLPAEAREFLAEAYRVTSEQLREASMRSLATAASNPLARLEAFLRAGFTDEFLDFHHLRMRIDLWSAACNSEVLAETERVLYDHYRQTLRELMVPLTDGSPEKAKNIPALLDSVMATQDGLWLDWLRRRNRGAVENGLRMCMNLVRNALSC